MGTQIGRPTVITPVAVRKLEQAFRGGLNVSQACYTTGISRTAYYARLEVDVEFADKMQLAQDYVTIKAKQLVVQEIQDGNLAAAKWWLERKARNEFGSQLQPNEELPRPEGTDDLRYILKELHRNADVAIAQAEAEARRAAEAVTPI